MISVVIGILNITWTISLMCSVYMALVFWRSRKNPLMNIFCIFVVLLSTDVLLSLIYLNDLTKVSREFCIFQALVLQFCAYATGITAFCFSMQTYRRIVLNSRESHRTKLFYYSICILYPCIMTTILATFSIIDDSIKPRGMTCDVVKPTWMRLVGYTGSNLILSPLGVYWSGRTALKVFRQQDKTENGATVPQTPSPIERDNSSNKNTSEMHSPQEESTDGKNFSPLLSHSLPIPTSNSSDKPPDHAKYRVAAKRLASFALGFLLINVIASISTLWVVIKNDKPMSSRIGSSDIIGSLLGISIFLIFGRLRI